MQRSQVVGGQRRRIVEVKVFFQQVRYVGVLPLLMPDGWEAQQIELMQSRPPNLMQRGFAGPVHPFLIRLKSRQQLVFEFVI